LISATVILQDISSSHVCPFRCHILIPAEAACRRVSLFPSLYKNCPRDTDVIGSCIGWLQVSRECTPVVITARNFSPGSGLIVNRVGSDGRFCVNAGFFRSLNLKHSDRSNSTQPGSGSPHSRPTSPTTLMSFRNIQGLDIIRETQMDVVVLFLPRSL
jgi:hypothetical protein